MVRILYTLHTMQLLQFSSSVRRNVQWEELENIEALNVDTRWSLKDNWCSLYDFKYSYLLMTIIYLYENNVYDHYSR